MTTREIELEDHGQDFTSFIVDEDGNVVETKPCQGWVWNGSKVMNKRIRVGSRLILRTPNMAPVSEPLTLRYRVIAISRPQSANAENSQPTNEPREERQKQKE